MTFPTVAHLKGITVSHTLPLFVNIPPLTAADAGRLVRAAPLAAEAGVTGLVLREAPAGSKGTIDPSVLAGYLGTTGPAVIVEAHTSRHAPYNLARRIQTLARITGGRAGLLLQADGVDPLSRANNGTLRGVGTPDELAAAEYVAILAALWASFPEDALVGDALTGIFANTDLLRPAGFNGAVYRVDGALNIPLDPRHRAVVTVEAEGLLGGARRPVVDAVLQPTGAVSAGPADGTTAPRRWHRLGLGVDLVDALDAISRSGVDAVVLSNGKGTDPLAALTSSRLADALGAGLAGTVGHGTTLRETLDLRQAVVA
ncbi:MAG: monooxygenase [Glaciihabitans sp.]|nr:monooxygenase [Glaciihabitans sp.]